MSKRISTTYDTSVSSTGYLGFHQFTIDVNDTELIQRGDFSQREMAQTVNR